jgi:uncharacterized protein (DUF2147 family)
MKPNSLIATTLLLLSIETSKAQDYSALYEARLSAQDHTSSDGSKLTDVASILRQDRANYHKFKKRDAEDQTDAFFSSAKHRELIDSYFKNVYSDNPMNAKDKQAILNGTPLVRVSLVDSFDGKFLSVEVLSQQANAAPVKAAPVNAAPNLVGEWITTYGRYADTVTYKADGTYVTVTEIVRGPAANQDNATKSSGTWKLNGEELVHTKGGKSYKTKIRFVSPTSFEEPSELGRNGVLIYEKSQSVNNPEKAGKAKVTEPKNR